MAARARRQRAQHSGALVERSVHRRQFAGEQFVVVAEFQQLRVGVLEQLNGGLGARFAVIKKSRVPADDRQIVGIVRSAGLQDFVAFAVGELGDFSAHNLRDASALGGAQLVGGGRTGNLPDVEDEVVLAQPLRIRLHQGRGRPLQFLADDAGRVLLKVDVPDPAAAQANQGVPVAGKGQLEDHAQDAVVVILDLPFEPLAAVQNQRLDRLDHRRPLIANVGRRRSA